MTVRLVDVRIVLAQDGRYQLSIEGRRVPLWDATNECMVWSALDLAIYLAHENKRTLLDELADPASRIYEAETFRGPAVSELGLVNVRGRGDT